MVSLLDGQHETPSFSMDLFADRVNTILDAPLPKCLRLKGESEVGQPVTHVVEHKVKGIVPFRSMAAVSVKTRSHSCVGSRHGKPIHEVLLDKGRLAAEHKEAMRQQALEKELSELRPAPNITYMDVRNTPRRGQSVEDRLLLRAKETEKRRECEAKRREEEMDKEIGIVAPFQPNISRRGRRATPKARMMAREAHSDWYRQREQRIEAARTAKIVAELTEVCGTPAINPRSERLAARRREREGLAGVSAHEALIERDRVAQLKRWEQHEIEKRTEATPQITFYAATLERNGDAAERLYAESYEKKERRLQRERELEADTEVSFTPRISPRAASKSRFGSVESELMQKHMRNMQLREEMRRMEEEQESRRHRPAINPVSEAIAARLPKTSLERLYSQQRRPARHVDPVVAVNAPSNDSCISVDSCGNGGCRVASLPESMAEALQSYEERRHEKIRRLREEQEKLQREKCTFAPVTNGNSHALGGPEHVASRSEQWLLRREWKLREMRQRKEAEKAKDCTFKPERDPLLVNSSRGDSVYGGDGTPWGVQEYLERQEEARRLRQEREARLQRRPSSVPRPNVTTPREFVLGRRDRAPIRSLQRPPQVPLMSPKREEVPSSLLRPPTTTSSSSDHIFSAAPDYKEGEELQHDPKWMKSMPQLNDLSVYERIYNRIYNNAVSSGIDALETSLCASSSSYN